MTKEAYKTTTAIAIAGSADSGKSSFIGVIISGKLDDGNGSARKIVAKHQHEIDSKKTSDISTKTLEIPENNTALTIIDLCGQEAYFKTTAVGISGYFPDYGFLIISANNGVQPMTRQHLKMLVALSIPIIIIITRTDLIMDKPKIYKDTCDNIRKMIKSECGANVNIGFANNPFIPVKTNISELANIEKNTINLFDNLNKIFDNTIKNLNINEKMDNCIDEINNGINSLIIERNNILTDINIQFINQTEIVKKKIIISRTIGHMVNMTNKQFTFPIISTSNKTGYYNDVIMELVKNLPSRPLWITDNKDDVDNNIIVKLFKPILIHRVYENVARILISIMNKYYDQLNNEKTDENNNENTASTISISNTLKNVVEWVNGKKKSAKEKMLEEIEEYNNNKNKNIIFMATSYILKKMHEENQLIKCMILLSRKMKNLEFSNIIKKLDIKELVEYPEIKSIFEQTCIFDLIRGKEIDRYIFGEYKNIEGNIFYIDSHFKPQGIGIVVSGINRGDKLKVGDELYLGPINNEFIKFKARSIHNNGQQEIKLLDNHDRGCIAISLLKKGEIRRNHIRKGMIIFSNIKTARHICYKFKAALKVDARSVTITNGYSTVIHLGTIRQTAIVNIDPEDNNGSSVIGFNFDSDNMAIVTFRFISYPEYIEPYNIFVFRNGAIHGLGIILQIIPLDEDTEPFQNIPKIKKRNKNKNI
jgi:GTPase/flagellar hook-basal body complex protein FliE